MAVKRRIMKRCTCEETQLGAAMSEFIYEKEAANLAARTIGSYKQSVRLFCEFHEFEAETLVNDITVEYFYDWIKALKKRGVKPTTINHYLRDCRTFFYWCMEKKYITEPYQITMIKYQDEGLKFFSEKDIALLLQKPSKNADFPEWRMWAIVNWMMATGNRAATVCEVRVGDIDYQAKEITLRHTKNKKAQIIPLSPSLEAALREYCKIWRAYSEEEDYLFPNVADEAWTSDGLRQAFVRYTKKRGVSRHNPHGLRHSFGRGWVKNQGNVFMLQKMLGHSTLDMTKRYVALFSDDLKEDYEIYSPLDTMKKGSKHTYTVKRHP